MAYRVRTKGSTTDRGYGSAHQRRRARWAPIMATGTVRCWRCGELIHVGTAWHLGHTDDRRGYVGPEHAACSAADGGRKTVAQLKMRRQAQRSFRVY
jgi:hypothetical protein